MPELDPHTVGDGPKQTAMWLDGTPCMVTGLDAWPKVGECLEIDGVLWRVVDTMRSTSRQPCDSNQARSRARPSSIEIRGS
jgi:hypothetical protein